MEPHFRARLIVLSLIVVGIGSATNCAIAADPATARPATEPSVNESLSTLAQWVVIESIPRHFEEQKDWGKTTKVVNGLRLKDDGDGLKVRKHTKEVKDGLWKQYRAELIDPEHQLQIRVENLRQTAAGHSAFQIFLSARLRGEARLEAVERWH